MAPANLIVLSAPSTFKTSILALYTGTSIGGVLLVVLSFGLLLVCIGLCATLVFIVF